MHHRVLLDKTPVGGWCTLASDTVFPVTTTELPQALATLARQLIERGFDEFVAPTSPSFGNRFIELESPPLSVRIILERRGWFLEVGHVSWDAGYDLDVWKAYVDGREAPPEISPLQDQATYLEQSLAEILNVLEGNPDTLRESLRAINARSLAKRHEVALNPGEE